MDNLTGQLDLIRDHTVKWLKSKIAGCQCFREKELGAIKACKKTDILLSTNSADQTLGTAQVEIESDKATTHKLGYGLVDQSSFLRNCKVPVDEISGLVVPVEAGYVDKVVCKWNDSELHYYLERKKVW